MQLPHLRRRLTIRSLRTKCKSILTKSKDQRYKIKVKYITATALHLSVVSLSTYQLRIHLVKYISFGGWDDSNLPATWSRMNKHTPNQHVISNFQNTLLIKQNNIAIQLPLLLFKIIKQTIATVHTQINGSRVQSRTWYSPGFITFM